MENIEIEKWGNVRVPNSLIKIIANHVKANTEFTSVSDFVVDSIRTGLRKKEACVTCQQ